MSWSKRTNGVKSDAGFTATTRILTRVIVYLSEIEEGIGITKIGKEVSGDINQIRDALHWLVNNKVLLAEKKTNARELYFINPKWDKLKMEEKE